QTSRSEVARPEGVGTVRGERERGATLPDERRACKRREARWRARRESEPFAASGSEARRFPTSAGRANVAKRGGAPGGSRTPGLQVRSLSLYPAELRARSRIERRDHCSAITRPAQPP